MKLTTEQIDTILTGAPDGATHWDRVEYMSFVGCGNWESFCNGRWQESEPECGIMKLTDLREILELRREVERLNAKQSEVAVRGVDYPMQPITKDEDGRDRFEENPIVSFLATEVSDLNKIAVWCIENNIDKKYQEQLAQLIGYSVDGYGTLSYVSDESYEHANQLREQGDE